MKYFKTETAYFHQNGTKTMCISLKNGNEFTIEKVNQVPQNAQKSTQNEFDTVFNKTLLH